MRRTGRTGVIAPALIAGMLAVAGTVASSSLPAAAAKKSAAAAPQSKTRPRLPAAEQTHPCPTCKTAAGLHVSWQVPELATVGHAVQAYREVSTGTPLHDVILRLMVSGAVSRLHHGSLAKSLPLGSLWVPASFVISRAGTGSVGADTAYCGTCPSPWPSGP